MTEKQWMEIDVSKAQLEIAVWPAGACWAVPTMDRYCHRGRADSDKGADLDGSRISVLVSMPPFDSP